MAAGLALICIVATMAQQSKLSNSGNHLISKMWDGTPLLKTENCIEIGRFFSHWSRIQYKKEKNVPY